MEHRDGPWGIGVRRCLALLGVGVAILGQAPAVVPAEADGVSSEPFAAVAAPIQGRRIAARVRFLASDFLEGREAGTRGERLAAEYIRDFYLGIGLSPAAPEGSFFQDFDLHETTLGDANAFSVIRPGPSDATLRTNYPVDDGFVPFQFSPSARVEAPAVFVGYGISAPEYAYDDYAGIDVRGAVVVLLRHEPRESDPDSPFKGLRSTKHAAFLSKVRLAQKKGAVGMVLVTDPANHRPEDRGPGNSLARWSSLVERGEFDTRPRPDPRQLYPEIAPDVRIPAVHVAYDVAVDLLSGLGSDLESVQKKIDETLKPASRKLPGVRVAMTTDLRIRKVPVRNVLARLDGSDPDVKDEVVIVGGHYDHVGYGHFGSATGAWGTIHPGADDNASGTAAILSVAEAFAQAAERPRRSIVFMHFTAEEKGLMGSRWYVEHPTFPLEKTIAMFNLDMVGRNDPAVVSVVGDARAAGVDALVKRIGTEKLGLAINNDAGSGIDRSDQWAFALKEIPAVAFFSGVHDEYHRPSDTASRIVAEKLQNVARLVALSVWEVAQNGSAAIETAGGGE